MAGEEKPRERLSSEDTAKEGESSWLDAYYDPVASLNTLTACMVLEDLNCDGDYKVNSTVSQRRCGEEPRQNCMVLV